MLTPQLKKIRERLSSIQRYSVDGTESLYQELQQLEKLLDTLQTKYAKNLEEEKTVLLCSAATSGPGDYCSCCGKKL